MSAEYKMTIPTPLMERIESMEGTYQQITLRALHLLVYGSPVEAELRAEVVRLHETIRQFGTAPAPPPPLPAQSKELGW